MSADLTAAIVSASATALVAVVAILTNSKRLDDTNSRIGRLESKLDHIKSLLVGYVLDVAKIKERLGIS